MSEELVDRLEKLSRGAHDDLSIGEEAVAEITRLRERNAELESSFEAHDKLLHQCLDERDGYKARIAVLESSACGVIPVVVTDGQYPKPEHGWTCFHCGDTFNTPGAARDHFGCQPSADPSCKIKVGEERGLVVALRRAEASISALEATVRELREALGDCLREHGGFTIKGECERKAIAALAASESVVSKLSPTINQRWNTINAPFSPEFLEITTYGSEPAAPLKTVVDYECGWNAARVAAAKVAECDKDNPTAGKFIAANIRALKRG